jgi:hypothetical protein
MAVDCTLTRSASMQSRLLFEGGSRGVTTTFERAFSEAERSAAAAAKAGSGIVAAAKQMQKAAQEGDIAKLRRAAESLGTATDSARQDVANARTAWPFSEVEEKEYLTDSYERELLEEGARAGLTIRSRDARLLAFPSILQLLPSELAIRVDRKRVPAIRPSHLVRTLLANQTKKQRYPVEQFVEALYRAYRFIAAGKGGLGSVVLLVDVYQAFTLQPGSARDYDKSDFARDVFMLDRSGVATTRSGARLSLPASTGTRGGSRTVFTFVAPNGEVVSYYGLRFTEG